jgi:putative ATP-binding cassette transporter
MYLRGEIEFGVVTQAAGAFLAVTEALSVVVKNFGSFSTYAALTRRLGAFVEVLDEASRQDWEDESKLTIREGSKLIFDKVSISTPDWQRVLIKDLALEVSSGERLLICGQSGTGKSAILRVVAGLWTSAEGIMERPPLKDCFFVPQRPYLILGTLRNQLLYGQRKKGLTDKELFTVLEQVELEEMFERVGGFNARVDWAATLSNGEQQRIGLARLILANPKYIFLDEATTAIEELSERRIYERILSDAKLLISVGYRSTLAQFHDALLEIRSKSKWKYEKLKREA